MDFYFFLFSMSLSIIFLFIALTQRREYSVMFCIMGAIIILLVIFQLNADGNLVFNGFGSTAVIPNTILARSTTSNGWNYFFTVLFIWEIMYWILMIFRIRR